MINSDPTRRTRSAGAPPAGPDDTQPRRAIRPADRRPWVLLGAVGVIALLALVVAAGTGYTSAVSSVQRTLAGQSASAIDEQFNLGVEDLLAGRFDLASQRFEYVLSLDPGRSDAAELLERAREALFEPTSTPGPTPTPITPTPTLDVASLDGLFGQAQVAFASNDWGRVIEAALVIRSRDPDYRRTELNSLLAQALRARGVQRILARDFELGIYDLALAERFGPLDGGAASWRNTAAFYTFANSFFVVDWARAAENFASLCNGDLWDACFKYARAAMEYGHQLMASGTPCAAATQYANSLNTRANPALEPTATWAAQSCWTPTPSPTGSATATPTITVSPTVGPSATHTATLPGAASDTPTSTPSPSPTSSPTSTPTETATTG